MEDEGKKRDKSEQERIKKRRGTAGIFFLRKHILSEPGNNIMEAKGLGN
jgi:hypothetical protein